MMELKNGAIVVPVHNAPEFTEQCLGQIEDYCPQVPLVLVDDASQEDLGEWLRGYASRRVSFGHTVRVIRNPKQQLFTRTVNRGIRTAYQAWDSQWVAVVNTDCNLQEKWLEGLLQGFDFAPRVGIVGYPDQHDPTLPAYRFVRLPAYITGHCMALSLAMLQELGVFCETDTDGRFTPELAGLKGQAHIGSDRIKSWQANAAGYATVEVNLPFSSHGPGASWNRNLNWLANAEFEWLWEPCDTLDLPKWYPV